MVGYRMLFGVPDEITDVTRVSGMVRKRRLIYRMTSFDYRKVFGVTGNVPGMTNGFREFTGGGGPPTPGKPIGVWGAAPALSGLVGQSKRSLCAVGRKSKRKGNKRRRWEREEGLHLPNQVGLGLGGESFPPWLGRPLGGSWTPRQGSPSLSYI